MFVTKISVKAYKWQFHAKSVVPDPFRCLLDFELKPCFSTFLLKKTTISSNGQVVGQRLADIYIAFVLVRKLVILSTVTAEITALS